ncbi:hypothetical protein MTO96_010084 [Rhipicephalus appendiculatus]
MTRLKRARSWYFADAKAWFIVRRGRLALLLLAVFVVAAFWLEVFTEKRFEKSSATTLRQQSHRETSRRATAKTTTKTTSTTGTTASSTNVGPLGIGRNVLGPNYRSYDHAGAAAPRERCKERPARLKGLVPVAKEFLRKQELDYGIYIIEQSGKGDFNRAKLLNVGYEVSKTMHDYNCFVFHDVDLIPENDQSVYACQENPYHLSRCLDIYGYKPSYPTIFGGVSALTQAQMEKVNGFSNVFWGWGGEDDDMSTRVRYSGYTLVHANCTIGRYVAMKHEEQTPSPDKVTHRLIRRSFFRIYKDGLNSLKYRVLDIVFKKLYTHVVVDLFQHKAPK